MTDVALDEKLTSDEHLNKLKTTLDRVSRISQHCREKDIKNDVDLCIKMCDIIMKKMAFEKKQQDAHVQQLEDQLHQLHGDFSVF